MEWNEGLDDCHPLELAMYSNAPMAMFNMLLGHDLINVPADSLRRCLQVAVRAERMDWLNALKGSTLVLPWSMLMLEKGSTVLSLLGWSIKNLAVNNVKFLLDVEGVDPAVCGDGDYRPSAMNAIIMCITMTCVHYDPAEERAMKSTQQDILRVLVHHPRVRVINDVLIHHQAAIHHAMTPEDSTFLRILLENQSLDVNPTTAAIAPLIFVSMLNRFDHATLLLRDQRCKLTLPATEEDEHSTQVLFDAVLYCPSKELVATFISHGCDPNAFGSHTNLNNTHHVHIFDHVKLCVSETRSKKDMILLVKVGRMLMEAGCRPRPTPLAVKSEINDNLQKPTRLESTKRLRKKTIRQLNTMAKRIPRLDELCRCAILGQIRAVNGDRTTYPIAQELGPPNYLTSIAQNFLNYR